MTETERKALVLVNEVSGREWAAFPHADPWTLSQALCRAIEQNEAFKREVSDAVVMMEKAMATGSWQGVALDRLKRFILPKPVDPLVEAMSEAMCGVPGEDYTRPARDLRAELAKRGLKIVENTDD